MLSFVALVGCIALVNESTPNGDQFSTTCTLLDTTSACGTCVASSCANQVTACCDDATCKTQLSQFDTCADAGFCTVDTSNEATSALATCMNSSCKDCSAEAQGDGSAPGTVDVSCGAVLDYCNCESASPGSKPFRCDNQSVPNSICCGDVNYPSSGSCSCMPVKCEQLIGTGGCECSPYESGDVSSCNSADGVCCIDIDTGTCSCDPTIEQCDQFGTPVDDCAVAANIGCESSQKAFKSCSQ